MQFKSSSIILSLVICILSIISICHASSNLVVYEFSYPGAICDGGVDASFKYPSATCIQSIDTIFFCDLQSNIITSMTFNGTNCSGAYTMVTNPIGQSSFRVSSSSLGSFYFNPQITKISIYIYYISREFNIKQRQLLVMTMAIIAVSGQKLVAYETNYSDFHCDADGEPVTLPTASCVQGSIYTCDMSLKQLTIFTFNTTQCSGQYRIDTYDFGHCYGGWTFACKQQK
ncbi:hypothetical protein DFA_04947 [Cavenderia fasciculata]|uniref:Transmembrane protein n=1 Tax=Cavenderia fasciculata TaxID=261658 RepID=F4PMM0_CACFS|nr:uncharacterized protein DFA_04947 [Cavenderia fasciculata]EGG22817.1 hypothetical protein DFA_04947 [Cavenderia fasciculata]|eukprot:XP_004360668.1 hypothetical protein DFA_04947 [Cavenderia fasciculata]